jgi:tyrosinase
MVNDIIPEFPKSDQTELKKAADVWRFPYWDWAMKKVDDSGEANYNVPRLIREKEVEVRVPGGTARIPNPFWQFRMPDGLTMGDAKLGQNIVTREPVKAPLMDRPNCQQDQG